VPLRGAARLRVLFAPLEGDPSGQGEGAVLVSPELKTVSDLDDPPTSPKVTDLLDLKVVSGEWWSNEGGSVPIDGKIFPRSFVPGFCFGPDTVKVEYTVARYKRLVGHVGVSDLAPSPWSRVPVPRQSDPCEDLSGIQRRPSCADRRSPDLWCAASDPGHHA
jgi:hypothetical protein